jgi:hypothetical protein
MMAFRRRKLAPKEHTLEGHYGSILAVILKIDSIALLWASSLPYLFGSFGHTFTSLISSSLQASSRYTLLRGLALSHGTGAVVGRAPTTPSVVRCP